MADIDSALPIRSVQDIDERVQVKVVDATTPAQQMEVDTDGDAHVKAKLRDDSGAAFGIESNPLYVVNTEDPAAEIHDLDTASAIAKDASADHSYTNANGAKVKSLHLSASGLAKFEVSFGTTASEILKYVYFNSTAKPSMTVVYPESIVLPSTDTMIITKTNLDNQAQDLYSTINGGEIN